MNYAEVAVNSPAAQRRTFSYSVPSGLALNIGHAVWVPFGSRILQGIVVELSDSPQVPETRDVHDLIEAGPVLTPAQVALARWISDRYLSPLFDSLALMLPPGFERSLLAFYELTSAVSGEYRLEMTERKVIELVRRQSKASLRDIERLAGRARAARIISRLVRDGLLVQSHELQRERVRPKMISVVALTVEPAGALERAASLKHRAPWQAAVLELLAAEGRALPLAVVRQRAGASAAAAVRSLARKGLVSLRTEEAVRDPLSHRSFARSVAPVLTSWQEAAWRTIQPRLVAEGDRRSSVFLLHGVTGSGKTELYLRALETVVGRGKRGVVLVPEISLTPQTIERFASRFPGRVAVLHSRLSLGEQHDEWRRVKRGGFDVVVGPRSALFAPQPDLGLIVIDEEHDWSYKQDEQVPRYHARDVALRMSEMYGAVVIMGSATPDVESYYRGEQGEYTVLRLPERVTPWGMVSLPGVEVVDMREELKSGNRSIFSRSLQEAMVRALSSKEQVIIFLNRRGSATFVQCRNCGHVLRCRRCTVSLTYHSAGEGLVCHECNSRYAVPAMCPECGSPSIRFLGIGTQRVEETIREMFPLARTLRWDRDISRTKRSDEELLERFLAHDADVLVGTQMVAKGLDMPLVTLVGVVNADVGLYLPDFRAGERTFQLLCQVVGRAGRGPGGGRAIIQTYSPEHYAVRASTHHDYGFFYEQEIKYRRSLGLPPFARLARLVYSHTDEGRCRREAERVAGMVAAAANAEGIAGLEVVGPAPAYVRRVRGKFRWQLVLRGAEPSRLLGSLRLPQGWTVDVDPASML